MLVLHSAEYLAPSIAARITEFQNNGDLAPYVVVENVDTAASASILYQEGDNGQDWTDITGTVASIAPGKSNGQLIVSSRRRIAIQASGNVRIKVSVVRQVDGSPDDLGLA